MNNKNSIFFEETKTNYLIINLKPHISSTLKFPSVS